MRNRDSDSSKKLQSRLSSRGYRLGRHIGSGSFGEVRFAVLERERGLFRRVCAVKIFKHAKIKRKSLRAARSMFLLEAHVLSRLQHDHIVQARDLVRADPYLCLDMEYIDGVVLSALVKFRRKHRARAAVPSMIALELIGQAARALHAAHNARDSSGRLRAVIHRDIKPDNLILGKNGRLRVLDFGVAELKAHTKGEQGTAGTPRYMSPEQARGEPLTPASDLYSLGLVLYELLMLEPMIPGGGTPAEVMENARTFSAARRLEPLRDRFPEVAPLLEQLVDPDPRRRPQDGLAVVEAVDALLDDRRPNLEAFCLRELEEIRQTDRDLVPPPIEELIQDFPATMIADGSWSLETHQAPLTGFPEPRPRRAWAWVGGLAALGLLGTPAVCTRLQEEERPATPGQIAATPSSVAVRPTYDTPPPGAASPPGDTTEKQQPAGIDQPRRRVDGTPSADTSAKQSPQRGTKRPRDDRKRLTTPAPKEEEQNPTTTQPPERAAIEEQKGVAATVKHSPPTKAPPCKNYEVHDDNGELLLLGPPPVQNAHVYCGYQIDSNQEVSAGQVNRYFLAPGPYRVTYTVRQMKGNGFIDVPMDTHVVISKKGRCEIRESGLVGKCK